MGAIERAPQIFLRVFLGAGVIASVSCPSLKICRNYKEKWKVK
jgi:hypothetical protein